jgi:2-polyprenyl-3-methyl-5-hydroxy-6-metoxy-1,4-benzoquinol methylase
VAEEELTAWSARIRCAVEREYLAHTNPYRQSGWHGDAHSWRVGREVILQAVPHDGSFLDIGCANGLLLESLVHWSAARGRMLTPYGIDLSPRLIHLAQQRFPAIPSHFMAADALRCTFERQHDYVHTLLEYVPEDTHAEYLKRLMVQAVAPGGRLIVSSYRILTFASPPRNVARYLESLGFSVAGDAASRGSDRRIATRSAWVCQDSLDTLARLRYPAG